LIYLEDWNTYQQVHNNRLKAISAAKKVSGEHGSIVELDRSLSTYAPAKCIIGRIIGEGPNIQTMYTIKERPYLGATTMDEQAAHFAAAAAQLRPGNVVLDPFCGTGSLLIACSYFGARVLGSDIDRDCLGLDLEVKTPAAAAAAAAAVAAASAGVRSEVPYRLRSKNSKFLRSNNERQLGLSVHDNIKHYKLENQTIGFLGADIKDWFTSSTVKGKLYENNTLRDVMVNVNLDSFSKVHTH
jgi:hypothetical protein